MFSQLRSSLRAVWRFLVPSGGVSERTVKSGVWVGLINVVNRLLQLGMVVIVARLIGPGEFGLMGIALLTLSALKRLTRLGIDTALIQHKEENVDEYLNTAWCLQVGRGILLAGVAYLLAPAITGFLGEPRAAPIVRLIALTTVLTGLANPGVMYLKKNLEFHRQFVYSLSPRLAYVVVAVGYALLEQSVWALAFGHLAGSVTNAIVSYLVHGYRPRPSFNLEFAGELLDYGKWIFGSSILAFLGNEGDDAFVSWYLGAASLGLYQLGYRLSNAPATEITHTVSEVVFPAYSKLQDDLETLRRGYFTTVQFVSFVTFPMATGIAVVMAPFVRIFLGDQWAGMILPAQLLAAYGLLRSLRTAATPLFRALGRPDYDTKIRILKLAVIAVLIYPASVAYGLVGVALVIVANAAVANPVTHYLAVRMVDGRPTEMLRVLAYPAAGSLIMGACVLLVRERIPTTSLPAEFVLSVCVGVGVYAAVMLAVERWTDYEMRQIVATFRRSFG